TVVAAGTPGNGKTLGAALYLITWDFCEEDDGSPDALLVNASRLDGYGPRVEKLEELCLTVGCLALDDVGMGKSSSGMAVSRIESIVCERANNQQYTYLTTNLAPDQFWPLFGGVDGRMADRVLSDPIGWVTCLEPSRRRR